MRFGLTGRMGCGKSTVASLLSVYEGFSVLDCDGLAKQVIHDPQHRAAIVAALGKNVFLGDTVDTGAIANIIFGDPIRKQAFERIVGPRLWEMVEVQTKDSQSIHVVEMAYLFEKQVQSRFDAVIVAVCSKRRQLERLRTSRGMSDAAIAARLKYQLPQERMVALGHLTINTDCSFTELEHRVEHLQQQLRTWKKEAVHA